MRSHNPRIPCVSRRTKESSHPPSVSQFALWKALSGCRDNRIEVSAAATECPRDRSRFRALGCVSKSFRGPRGPLQWRDPQPINLNPAILFAIHASPRWESEIRVSAPDRSKETDSGRGVRNDFLLSRRCNQPTVMKASALRDFVSADGRGAFIENYVVDVMRLWERLCCSVIMGRERIRKGRVVEERNCATRENWVGRGGATSGSM